MKQFSGGIIARTQNAPGMKDLPVHHLFTIFQFPRECDLYGRLHEYRHGRRRSEGVLSEKLYADPTADHDAISGSFPFICRNYRSEDCR
jgi:hypothetical protein